MLGPYKFMWMWGSRFQMMKPKKNPQISDYWQKLKNSEDQKFKIYYNLVLYQQANK